MLGGGIGEMSIDHFLQLFVASVESNGAKGQAPTMEFPPSNWRR